MPTIHWTHEDSEGNEITEDIPAIWGICGRCGGEGTHDHPAFSGGITSSEWAEWGDDDRSNYLSGRYDVQCDTCGGTGKIKLIDMDRCDSDLLERYNTYQDRLDSYRRMCEAERRMGA